LEIAEFMFGDPNDACGNGNQFPPIVVFVDASASIPLKSGAVLFVDDTLSMPFDGQFQWWYVFTTNQSILVDNNGIAIDVINC
jgi:hypothetical protein